MICFTSVFVADLWEVGAPCGFVRPAWSEGRPGGGEQLLGGAVGFHGQRNHDHLLGWPPVRTLLTANHFIAMFHFVLTVGNACWKADTLFLSHYISGDKCLQGLANATVSGMTSHTTCKYFVIFTVFFCFHTDSPSLLLCCVMLCGWCMLPKCRWIS